jgi:uncharacterized phiE125 gp8 family phage protein
MPLITITPPDAEPVSVDDVKISARVDAETFDDQLALLLIPAIRAEAEHRLGRRLITQTVELVLDDFPAGEIDLRLPSVQTVTSIKYLDTAGAEQTFANTDYSLDTAASPGRVLLDTDASWPATQGVPNAVRVRYVVGYGDDDASVPANIRLWITAHVVQALDNPSGLNTSALQPMQFLDRLLDAERFYSVPAE